MYKKTKNVIKKEKLYLKKDNLKENKIIKSLEKKLKIKNKAGKYLPKAFLSDGLDYLLEICNGETKNIATESTKQLQSNVFKKFVTNDNIDFIKSVNNTTNNIVKNKIMMSNCKKSIESISESDINKNCKKNKFYFYKNCQSNFQINRIDNDNDINKNFITKKKVSCKKDAIILKNIPVKKNKLFPKILNKDKIKKSNTNFLKNKLNFDSSQTNLDLIISNKETNFNNKEYLWQDIYGKKRNKDGTIISKNRKECVFAALKLNGFESNTENSEKLLPLKRQLKGLLNRLTESNMHVIISQLDKLYMSNSRNDMNNVLSNVMLESIVTPTLTPERLIIEHMMCITIFHANIGVEIGAYFIMIFIKKLKEMIEQPQNVQNKKLENLCLMISYLYNFKVFGSQLIYEILNMLIHKFTEKEIELILLFLKTVGFRLRKDDPIALKELILSLQRKAVEVKLSNSRIQFMLEMLLAIKNNNMKKISQCDQSYIEHLKKILKTLIIKGNTISQLNLSFEDLLNADKMGKWWIVGSAWSGKSIPNNELIKSSYNKTMYSQKILNLARIQRMNTDIRKNIFCILMTAEDYLDAFEKLHRLGLKDHQEKEIISVILNCLLQENTFNPYYSILIQKFCEYDRKYQMIIQHTLWDKIKILNNYNDKQVINIAKLMSHLFIQKALPLSVLKVIQLEELKTSTMKLFRKIMLDILVYENTEASLHVFERIAFSIKLHQFRESLKLFMNYFLLKNIKKDQIPEKQFQLLEKRIEVVNKILTTSVSKISF